MKTTRRAAAIMIATALATGAVMTPSTALRPPQPDTSQATDVDSSPAMTAGRAWCACNGLDYQPLWIR